MANPIQNDRVRITAYFQGRARHESMRVSLGRMQVQLPDSQTSIDMMLPDYPVEGRFEPLNFLVKKEGDLMERPLEGMRLTADKAQNFAMSVIIFEPSGQMGDKTLMPNGTIHQRELLRRTVRDVSIERPDSMEPGTRYRMEITVKEGKIFPQVRLVKNESIDFQLTAPSHQSALFKVIYPEIFGQLTRSFDACILKAGVALSHQRYKIKNVKCSEDVSKSSFVTAIKKLHGELRGELETMCQSGDGKVHQSAIKRFVQALDRMDLGQLLIDQLEHSVGKDNYPSVFAAVYNDIFVPYIDACKALGQ